MTTPDGLPDTVVVHPLRGGLRGAVRVPGDKSISHRAFLLGALAGGPVPVVGAAPSADVRATVEALRRMGATIVADADGARVQGPLREPDDVLDCGNAGTTMRLLAGVCAGIDGLSVLTGDASLRRRPMERIAAPLRRMGATIDGRRGTLAPLAIRGGPLTALDYTSPVASAQVKSCLLLAGLRADGTTRVREPGPSRDHTERMLRWLGADAGADADGAWVRPGPLAPCRLEVPADPSSAAFWVVGAAIVEGSAVRLRQVCLNPTRTGVFDVLDQMGANLRREDECERSGEPVGDLAVEAGRGLTRGEVDGDLVVRAIDELPILAVAAVFGGGLSVRDAAELRVKESDRIDGIQRVVAAIGGRVDAGEDWFDVEPGSDDATATGEVDAGGDHRLAMAAAIGALAARRPVTITGFGAVGTSYPTFLDDLETLGGRWDLR